MHPLGPVTAALLAATLIVPLTSCGGKGETDASTLSVQGELAQESYDQIRAAVDAGNAAGQEFDCAFMLGLLLGREETDADRALSLKARELCYGEIHRAMYEQTIADVQGLTDPSTIPFLECVPAQAALADEAKELDVPGLAEAKARAKQLCEKAWAD